MGMFDEIKCLYPLPGGGYEGRVFQTKDTLEQAMDLYEIRADGSLWHEDYDLDQSYQKVNKRFVPCESFSDTIYFYDFEDRHNRTGWVKFSAEFADGSLIIIKKELADG